MSNLEIKKTLKNEVISIVKIHPLVIMNISDHWTRISTQNKKNADVLGALLGIQCGREIEITSSFELLYDISEEEGTVGDISINKEYFDKRKEQFKQVFSEMDVVGWYHTGSKPSEHQRLAHSSLSKSGGGSSLLLLLLGIGASTHSDLPVTIHESVVDERDHMTLRRVPYTIETDQSERIAIEHAASNSIKMVDSEKTQPFEVERNAIEMLSKRVKIIEKYLKDVVNGKLIIDHSIVRSIMSICRRLSLPVEDVDFYRELEETRNDVNIAALLAVVTKRGLQVDQFVGRQNMIGNKKKTSRGKVREMMF